MIFGKVDDRISIKFSENALEEKLLKRKTIRLLAAHMNLFETFDLVKCT